MASSFIQVAANNNRSTLIIFETEPLVATAIGNFSKLLSGDERISIPLACRQSFPFADQLDLLVIFADASGPRTRFEPQPMPEDNCEPGYGAWLVRGKTMYFIHGLWSISELLKLNISVLEFLISFWAEVVFSYQFPEASHILEFTDNTATEWSAKRDAERHLQRRLCSVCLPAGLNSSETAKSLFGLVG